MRLSNQIVLASTNREKFEEFVDLLKAHPGIDLIPVESLVRNAHALGTVEKHNTYLENALAKARLVNQGCHFPSLSDDSGLEVLALEGRPGVRSARYAPPRPGLTQDRSNLVTLLEELKGNPRRDARFVCTLALVMEGVSIHATGVLEGTLTEAPRGIEGFGYDPIFVPKGASKTLAEMTRSEKNLISHRSRALDALMKNALQAGVVFAKP